jgi:hypothetical protein
MAEDPSVFKKVAEVGAQKLLDYFNTPADKRDSEAAAFGLKAGSNFSRLYAAETNRLAVQVAAAKAIGLKGEALIPVFEAISGVSAQKFLPTRRERSGRKAVRAA